MRRFLQPSLSIIMFGGLLLLATTLAHYYCVPIGSDDEPSKTRSRSVESYGDSPESSNHFCSRLYSGDFEEDIHLQSFSPRRSHLRMFENGNLYKISRQAIEEHHVELPEQYIKFSLDKTLGSRKQEDLVEQDLMSIYDIRLGDSDSIWNNYFNGPKFWPVIGLKCWVTLKRPLILLTSTGEFIWNIIFPWRWSISKRFGEIVSNPMRNSPDYALVFRQTRDDISGYVINQDIYGPSHDFIIYDLSLPSETLRPNVQSRQASNENKSTAPYYYLHKTENPNEVLLVHRDLYEEPEDMYEDRELFHSLPRGFVHEFHTDFTIFIYLFDTQLGCVYVLDDLLSLNEKFKDKENHRVSRINIPYEQFFDCPEQYRTVKHKLKPDRCNTTITHAPSFFAANKQTIIIGIIASIALLSGAVVAYLCYVKKWYKMILNSSSFESDSPKTVSPTEKKDNKKKGKVLRKEAVTPIRKVASPFKKTPKGVLNSYSRYKSPSAKCEDGIPSEPETPKKSPGEHKKKNKKIGSTIMIMPESSFKNSPISDPVRLNSED